MSEHLVGTATHEPFDLNGEIDIGDFYYDLISPETQNTIQETLSQLQHEHGDRVFTYKNYSGTVYALQACPAFMIEVENGFAAANAWLESHDGILEEQTTDDTQQSSNDNEPSTTQIAESPIAVVLPKKESDPVPKTEAVQASQPADPAVKPAVVPEVVSRDKEPTPIVAISPTPAIEVKDVSSPSSNIPTTPNVVSQKETKNTLPEPKTATPTQTKNTASQPHEAADSNASDHETLQDKALQQPVEPIETNRAQHTETGREDGNVATDIGVVQKPEKHNVVIEKDPRTLAVPAQETDIVPDFETAEVLPEQAQIVPTHDTADEQIEIIEAKPEIEARPTMPIQAETTTDFPAPELPDATVEFVENDGPFSIVDTLVENNDSSPPEDRLDAFEDLVVANELPEQVDFDPGLVLIEPDKDEVYWQPKEDADEFYLPIRIQEEEIRDESFDTSPTEPIGMEDFLLDVETEANSTSKDLANEVDQEHPPHEIILPLPDIESSDPTENDTPSEHTASSQFETVLLNERTGEDNDTSSESIATPEEILSFEPIADLLELVDEQPDELPTENVTEIRTSAIIIVEKIEILQLAVSAHECREAIAELRKELVSMLSLVGYSNAEEIADRLIGQYDVKHLKKYMAAIVQSLTSPERALVPQTPSVDTDADRRSRHGGFVLSLLMQSSDAA